MQRTKTLALTGAAHAGDRWVIRLNADDFAYVVQAGDTLAQIASALAALVDAEPGYAATASAGTISVTDETVAAFELSFRVEPAGTGAVGGVPGVTDVILSGAAAPGDVWRIELGGTLNTTTGLLEGVVTVTHTVTAGQTLADVAAALQTALAAAAGFTVARSGLLLTITHTDGTDFRLVLSVTPASTGFLGSNTKQTVTLTGPVNDGDVWSIVLDGTRVLVRGGRR